MVGYQYFILGAILGIAIALYIFATREEKIEREISLNKRLFSSTNLDKSLEKAVELIGRQIKYLNRELTDQEKDEIIYKCYSENHLKQ